MHLCAFDSMVMFTERIGENSILVFQTPVMTNRCIGYCRK